MAPTSIATTSQPHHGVSCVALLRGTILPLSRQV